MDSIMDGPIIFLLIGLAVLTSLAAFWYLFQTVRIIWGYNSLLAIASVIFSPFIHIFFYFMPKDEFSKHEAGLFKKYFLSIGLLFLVAIGAGVAIPTINPQKDLDTYSSDNMDFYEINSLANQRDADAQFNLAKMYYLGESIPQDYDKAFHWSQKSAEQGHIRGQMLLGSIYQEGKAVDQDYTEAAKWYKKAAEQDYVEAQSRLGGMYFEGRGVRRDYIEAAKWYRKAADQGDDSAQYYLGAIYDSGEGVGQDYIEAAKWYKKAADQDNSRAQFFLGAIYQYGKGVRQDYAEAKEWFGKSCDNGLQVGCDMYKELN